jgi:hypothetical protein
MLKRARTAVAIVAFLALFGFLAFQSGVATKQYPQQQQTEASAAEGHEGKNPFERFWKWTTHDPVAFYTSLLALFTLILGASTVLLWWETRQIRSSAAEDTRTLQRAYVSVEPLGTRLRIDGASVMGHVAIHNAGNLPASDLNWFINIKWSFDDREEDFPLSRGKGSVVITPGSKATRGSGSIVGLQDMLDASGASLQPDLTLQAPVYIYVWGIVTYHDGFTAGRVTKFCHRYNWAMRGGTGYSVDTEHARLHEFGNDST